ncbi:MAG: alpha-2-macroglobulin, partial [Chloroflexota bacterium]
KRSNPYVSSYAMFALAYAKEMDLDVPAHVIEKGVAYLRSQLVTAVELSDFHQANRQAWVLYVLDLHGSDISSEVDDLYRKRDKLSHYGRAYIAMTLGDDRRVDTLLSDLTNEVILSATGAHWEENERDWWAMNTDTRSTAIILDALTQLDPENQLIPNAIRWLMVARKGGIWETTQETAWALIAFTDWMAYTGELEGNYDWEVLLDRESWSNGTVTPDNIQDPIIMMRALGAMEQQAGGHPLVISRGEGEGRLYYSAHMRAYLPVEDVDAVNRGIIVQRRYVPADCEKITDCAPVDSAKVGEEIKVHLTIIVPNSLYYVVVEDPIPAGAEPIDTILDTTSVLEEGPQLRRQSEREVPWWGDWWWQWYSRSEMRDNKVVLFADYLAPGTYDYTYSFRATVPGEYRVIPAFANEFYFPEVFGRTDGSLFTITE